ncbi:YncE family protein [Thermopetrobacter sp. TC1]|uniref:YncE family protein n=1 Tax=Thermopetrobacter sp. TC1 TaxID=1495045 RepID=UPI00057080DA|nr:hypothetical protein [Thermopetrobacter sp. TC1]
MSKINRRRFLHSAFAAGAFGLAGGRWARAHAAALPQAGLQAPYDHYVFVPNRNSADVAIIDTDRDVVIARVPVGNVPHQVAVSDVLGKLIATNIEDNTVSIIDLASLRTEATLPLGHEPEHMELSPRGTLAAVGNIGEGTVSLVRLDEKREVRRITGLFEPHNMTFSPDGRFIYVGNLGANFISVIDVARGAVIDEIGVGENVALAALPGSEEEHQGIINVTRTPDGRLGFAAYGDGDAMAVIDLRTRRTLKTLRLGRLPWRAYSTADGRFMIIPNNGDGSVSIVSTRSPFKEVARLKGAADMTGVNTGWFETVAFVISRGADRLVILDLLKMENAGIIGLGKGATPETGVVTPDGKKLYVALSGLDQVALIDTRTRRLIKRISGVGSEPWGAHMVGALNYCH